MKKSKGIKMTHTLNNPELVGKWSTDLKAKALFWKPTKTDTIEIPDGALDLASFEYHVKRLPSAPIALHTSDTAFEIASKSGSVSYAAIDNGPIVTKAGVRRGNNSLATRHIGKISRHNPQRKSGLISHSVILDQRAQAKKCNALSIPEQVGAMINKSRDLEASIAKKLSKGHDATNLVKCLAVLQNRVRFLLDHCEEKGLLEIHPMKTGKAIGSLGKKA